MAKIYTPEEIDKINLERTAKKGVEYKDTRGYTFVWVEEDKLRLKETSSNIIYVPSAVNEVTAEEVQGAIDQLSQKIIKLNAKVDNNYALTTQAIADSLEEAKCFATAMALVL